jgi:hypothetical protein
LCRWRETIVKDYVLACRLRHREVFVPLRHVLSAPGDYPDGQLRTLQRRLKGKYGLDCAERLC